MKPQTTTCPFCKTNLKDFARDEYTHVWCCEDCKCETDRSMPRYVVTWFKPDNAYQQEFGAGSFYVKNNYHGKETNLCYLEGCMIVSKLNLPFKVFDLENMTEEELINKFKLWYTFS